MKVCTKCKIEKELSEFGKRKDSKDGLLSRCKPCFKEYYQENKGKIKEKFKKYYQENKEKSKKYYQEKREYYKEKSKKYYQENKEYYKEKSKENYQENKEYFKEKSKEHYQENKEYYKEYQRERRKTDSLFKMKNNLRKRTYGAFKRKGYRKNTKTQQMLGVDWEVAKAHIEKQFTKGMNLDNYGEWHIDHIIPLASAKTEKELIKLCHYSNLQPLWAEDNIIKSDKIIGQQIKIRM